MPQIHCNNHTHAAHAICSSGAECHGHANAPSSTALWPFVPMRMSLPCRSAATPTNQPKWRHKAKHEASRLAGRSVKCSRALRSSAGHICFMDWCRETPDSLATAAMDRTCHAGATIGFLLARFKWGFLCLTNHIVILRLEKNRLESEQEPPFGGTKRAPCLLCSRTRLRTIS